MAVPSTAREGLAARPPATAWPLIGICERIAVRGNGGVAGCVDAGRLITTVCSSTRTARGYCHRVSCPPAMISIVISTYQATPPQHTCTQAA
jgi:hypothetical protein